MSRPTGNDDKDSSNTSSGGQSPRRTRRRRRTLLNLGMPFVQMDDFVNQSEDAVAIGYRVLEDTVKEIQQGYAEAKAFNEKQKNWDGKGPAPAIPWEQLVERVQGLQNIALQAVKDGTGILFDSIKSGTNSVKSVARTWEQANGDVTAPPVLAGPVFEERIDVTVSAGERLNEITKKIRHRGLTRLRIHAEMNPELKELQPSGTGRDPSKPTILPVQSVTLAPATPSDDEVFSVLTVAFGTIPADQKAGVYEGLIRAKNFELLIAKLRVRVVAPRQR
jgi:hypothetical protein